VMQFQSGTFCADNTLQTQMHVVTNKLSDAIKHRY
jgi:hypothetical protein